MCSNYFSYASLTQQRPLINENLSTVTILKESVQCVSQFISQRSPWLGGKYSTTSQQVVWAESGVVVDNTFWRSGEPNTASGTKTCAYLANESGGMEMAMDSCDFSDVFICEINFS